MYSNQISKRSSIEKNNSVYKKTIIIKDQNKAFSIILHSIILHEDSISGYSAKYDSLMIFPALPEDIHIVKNKLSDLIYDYHKCNICHQNQLY